MHLLARGIYLLDEVQMNQRIQLKVSSTVTQNVSSAVSCLVFRIHLKN